MGFTYKQLLRIFFPPSPDERCFEAAPFASFTPRPEPVGPHTTALLPYREPAVRAAIHLAKFHHHAGALAALRYTLSRYLSEEPAAVIVPIPLSSRRFRERGYNQVVEVVTGVDCRILPLLYRHRHTVPQADLERARRLHNLAGAFSVAPQASARVPQETPLLILDDVTTTGSTLREARQTLLSAGFRNVRCLALAH